MPHTIDKLVALAQLENGFVSDSHSSEGENPSGSVTLRVPVQSFDATITEVRTQNAPFLLARALGNRTHGPVAWHFVRQNWSTILERFPSSTIVRMGEGVRWLVPVAADVEGFFAEHRVPQSPRTMEQHLERLRIAIPCPRPDMQNKHASTAP